MTEGQTVVTGAADGAPALGSLFSGKSFFLAQRVPSRQHFISQIQANGGRVVKLELQADHIIADHKRRDAPAGSVSWTFVTQSLKDGELADPADHPAGPALGSTRVVGSGVPGKATRTPFTEADDNFLWNWVQASQMRGGMVKGNQIYQELEKRNPRHTFQAWRDRYLKKMHGIRISVVPAPTAPATQAPQPAPAPVQAPQAEFTQDNFDELLLQAGDILNVPDDRLEDAWQAWQSLHPDHTTEEWAAYFDEHVKPEHLRRTGLRNGDRGDARDEEYAESEEEEPEPEPTPTKAGKRKREAGDDPLAGPSTKQKTAAPTSQRRANHAQGQAGSSKSQRDQTDGRDDTDEALHTSEANAAIQAQIQGDVDAQELATTSRYAHGHPQPKVAEAREYLEEKDEEGEHVDQALLTKDLEAPASSNQHHPGEGPGQALTEENLASQQAQHRVRLMRGKDVPEGEDNQDQSGFLEYLQDTMQEAKRNDREGPAPRKTGRDGPQDQGSHAAESEHMFSSQANNDHGGVDLRWPSMSPQAQRNQTQQAESQDFNFETQVNYPIMPTQYPGLSGKPGKLPAEADAAKLKTGEQYSGQARTHWIDQQQKGQRDEEADAPADDDIGNLDLSIPEPEGGFEFGAVDAFGDGENGFVDGSTTLPEQAREPAEGAQNDEERNARRSTEIIISPNSASSSNLQSQAEEAQQNGPRTLDTQGIVNAETQQLDFDMPLPPDSDEDQTPYLSQSTRPQHHEKLKSPAPYQAIPRSTNTPKAKNPPLYELAAAAALSQPRRRSAPPARNPAESRTLDDDDIMTYIAFMVERGYSEQAVFEALQATSMRPELAEEVLWQQRQGRGFPQGLAGVWTQEEDRLVEGGDAGAMRELEGKHGWEECMGRLEYLKEWREA